jgi:uncharacterized protein (TIGR02996 family)
VRNPALEQLIAARPDDDTGYVVYGDWLQEQGDPRGELIALQQRLHATPDDVVLRDAEAELLNRQRDAILGPLAASSDGWAIDWRLGFIRGAWLHGAPSMTGEHRLEDVLAALVGHASAAFLRELTIGELAYGRHTHGDPQAVVDALLALPLPATLRSLFLFDDLASELTASLANIATRLPMLDKLVVSGASVVVGDRLPAALRALSLRNERQALLANLAVAVAVPTLEALAVWCGPITGGELAVVLRAMPPLRELRLRGLRGAGAVVDAVLASPLLDQLTVLEISSSDLGDDGARRLAAAMPRCTLVVADGDLGRDRPAYRYTTDGRRSFLASRVRALVDTDPPRPVGELADCAGIGAALYGIGTQLLIKGEARALPLLRASLAFPAPWFHRRAWANLAIGYASQGRQLDAIETARRGLVRFPFDPNLHTILIDALIQRGELAAALAHIDVARPTIDDTPEGMALCVDVMLTYVIAGRAADAVAVYEWFGATEHVAYVGAERNPQREQGQRARVDACAALAYVHAGRIDDARAIAGRMQLDGVPNLRGVIGHVAILHHVRACIAVRDRDWLVARSERDSARGDHPQPGFLAADPILATIPP